MIEQICSGYRRSTLVEELDHLPLEVPHHIYKGEGQPVFGSQFTCGGCEACMDAETNYLVKKYFVVGEKEYEGGVK